MPSIRVVLAPALVSGLVLVSAGATGQPPADDILLESATMTSGQTMPRLYTPDGRNLSPPITWHNLPANTRAIAIVCADFGAGMPPPWVHWIIYNIPATAKGLPAGLPILPETPLPDELSGAIQGLNGWRRPYYRGPAPPVGTPHIYHFTIYALDEDLDLEPGRDRDELLRAMDGHIIGQGELAPIYQRFAN